jgi:hypothetical protein
VTDVSNDAWRKQEAAVLRTLATMVRSTPITPTSPYDEDDDVYLDRITQKKVKKLSSIC